MKTKLTFLLVIVVALSRSATVANNRFQRLPVTEQYAVGTNRFGDPPVLWVATNYENHQLREYKWANSV
jgi:hypothetical protein